MNDTYFHPAHPIRDFVKARALVAAPRLRAAFRRMSACRRLALVDSHRPRRFVRLAREYAVRRFRHRVGKLPAAPKSRWHFRAVCGPELLGLTAWLIDDEIGPEERQGREAVNAVTADRGRGDGRQFPPLRPRRRPLVPSSTDASTSFDVRQSASSPATIHPVGPEWMEER